MQGQARSYLNIHQNPVPPPPELYNGSQYFQYFDFSSSNYVYWNNLIQLQNTLYIQLNRTNPARQTKCVMTRYRLIVLSTVLTSANNFNFKAALLRALIMENCMAFLINTI